MPLSSPLDIAWTHAYWAEGPEFTALGLADGASVSSWPDEAGTDNLAQATASRQPTFVAGAVAGGGLTVGSMSLSAASTGGDANFNGKALVRFAADSMSVDWANLSQPNEVVLIGRLRNKATLDFFYDGVGSTQRHYFYWSDAANPDRYVYAAGGGELGIAQNDVNTHLFRIIYNTTSSSGYLDEVLQSSGSVGSHVFGGITVGGNYNLTTDGYGNVDIAFLGVKNGSLTATERSDFKNFATSYWGTP